MSDQLPQFARYLSSVKGFAVSRYGHGYGPDSGLGCRRTKDGFVWDTDEIVAIPHGEALRFQAEYDGHVRRGELVERRHAEWVARVKSQAAAAERALEAQRLAAETAAENADEAVEESTNAG